MEKYDVSIFIITKDNQYIPPCEYDKNDDEEGIFVCLTNEILNYEYDNNNSICIYKDWRDELKKTSRRSIFKNADIELINDYICSCWQKHAIRIPNNERFRNKGWTVPISRDIFLSRVYLDGERSCQNIMTNINELMVTETGQEEQIPAIMLAYHTRVDFNGKRYHGYLPSIGQLIFISENILNINKVLEQIGIQRFDVWKYNYSFPVTENNTIDKKWWSSTEFESNYICGEYVCCKNNGSTDALSKLNNDNRVLPLYAL